MTGTGQSAPPGAPKTRSESFDCGGPIEIDVRLGRGRVEVRAGEASVARVDVTAEGDDRALAKTVVSWSEGRRLTVKSPREHRLRRHPLDVVIQAPACSQLRVAGEAVDVAVAGPLHSLETRLARGDVTAERVGVATQARTGRGDLRVAEAGGRLRVATGAGEIAIGAIDGERAVVSAGRGDVRLGTVRGHVSARTGRGAIEVGQAEGGRVDLASGAGDVRIGIRPGTTAAVDLRSGSRRARSELPVGGPPSPDAVPTLSVRAVTGSGEAVLTKS